jgi:hypothetical protein
MSVLTTHSHEVTQEKRKRKETNKKKPQQAIESQRKAKSRSLEEDKSRTP